MNKPTYFEVLKARNNQLMAYPFMTEEQIEKAEKEFERIKREFIKC